MSANNGSKIAIGTAQFGMNYGIANQSGQVAKLEVAAILELAREFGIDTMDTAKTYGNSEDVIGTFLTNNEVSGWKVITKISGLQSSLSNQLRDSIEKLTITPFAILAHSASLYLQDSFQRELNNLKETKPAIKFGLSLYSETEIRQVLESAFVPEIIQLPLNIVDTRLYRRGVLDNLKDKGIDIHIRSVFLQGLFYLSDEEIKLRFPDVFNLIKQLRLIAEDACLTIAELSLHWVYSLEQVDKVIIGIDNVEQLRSHLRILKKKVDPAVFKEALSIKYENENILNPSKWLIKS